MRRLAAALVIIVIVLGGAWVGGWYWLAGWVERHADPALAEISRRGVDVDCPNRRIVGFPFAVRIACGETAVSERSTGTRAKLTGATGGGSVFRPMTAEIGLVSPVRVESPLLDGPIEFRWKRAAVDVGVGMSGPQAVSFDATDLLGAFSVPGMPEQTVAAASAKAHVAPSENGGSAVTVTFTDLAVATGGTRFPPVSGSMAAELSVTPRALAAGRAGLKLPIEARGIEVAIENGGAHLALEGDVAVSPGGIIDGTVVLRVAGAEALPQFIAALPEQFQKIGNAVAGALFAFGQPTTINGLQASEVHVTIVGNHATIGPIEVELPRIRL